MKTHYLYAFIFLSFFMLNKPTNAADHSHAEATVSMESRFAEYGHDGAFLLKAQKTPAQTLYGKELSTKRLPPASTFKVLLALVALETGALKNANEVIPWDGQKYPNRPEWQADMALKQAMQTSSENYFAILAKRIGQKDLAKWVKKLNYGNRQMGLTPEKTWHDGVFNVNASEQLDFIDRMQRGALPFSKETLKTVKAAMLNSEKNGYRIYGKTGSHSGLNQQHGVGWWIGWVEAPNTTTSFVLQVDLKAMDKREQRLKLAEQLMIDAKVLPKQ